MNLIHIQNKSKNLISSILIIIMFGSLVFQANNFLSKSDIGRCEALQKTSIETIDENTAKIHFNDSKSTKPDIILSKISLGNKFIYSIKDSKSDSELYNWESKSDIDFKDTKEISSNSKLNCIIEFVLSGCKDVATIRSAVVAIIAKAGELGWIEVVISLAAEGESAAAIAGLILTCLPELGMGVAITVAA